VQQKTAIAEPSVMVKLSNYWDTFTVTHARLDRFVWKWWPILWIAYLAMLIFSYLLDDLSVLADSKVNGWDFLTSTICINGHCSSLQRNIFSEWRLFAWFILLSSIPILLNRWQRRIPDFFQEIASRVDVQSHPEHGQIYLAFLEQYRNRLNNAVRYLIMVGFAFLVFSITYLTLLIDKTRRHLDTSHFFTLQFNSFTDPGSYARLLRFGLDITEPSGGLIIATLVASISILYAWPIIITGLTIHRLPRVLLIAVEPDHPDQCGGMRFVGNFCLDMALPVAVGSIIVGLLAGDFVYHFTPEVQTALFIFLLVLIVPSATLSFFLPLWGFHVVMSQQRHEFERQIYPQIATLQRALLQTLTNRDMESARRVNAELQLYQSLQPRKDTYPTWPFDRELFLGFFIPQLISVVGPFVSFIPSLLKGA
jgi:hypothetical protein